MPSPFPGMNPFLEQSDTWEDFDTNFVTAAQHQLARRVGPNCLVKVLVTPAVEIERHRNIEIRDSRSRRLVTVMEILSPSNKAGIDRGDHLSKRLHVLRSDCHFVEIDLRRGGQRPSPPPLPACDYYVLVIRAEERPEVGVWPIFLRERLPVIPVPLAVPDPDVDLDLQQVLHEVYDEADYGKYIYSEAPEPPLSADDAAWARQCLPGTASN